MQYRVLSLAVNRLILATFLLAYQILGLWVDVPILPFQQTLWILLALTGMTIFYIYTSKRPSSDQLSLVFLQFFFDIFVISGLIVFTGGDSLIRLLYLLQIILAAIFLNRIGIYVVMVVSLGFYYLANSLYGYFYAVEYFDRYESFYDPSQFPVLASQVFLSFVTALISGFMQNVYRSSRKALKIQEQQVQALIKIRKKIVDSLPSGLISSEHHGAVVFINRAGLEILGESEESIKERSIWDIFHIERPSDEVYQQLTISRLERSITIAGAKRSLGISFTPLEMESGAQGYLFLFQDLTKIKLLEAHNLLADKMGAIGKVAAGIAHEIRNPLASISGSIQVLRELLPDQDQTARSLTEIVEKETKRLNETVSEFLAYARPMAPPHFEPVSLSVLMDEFVELWKNDPQFEEVELHVTDCGDADNMVMADRAKIKQVFWNLARNAVQACQDEDQGRIEMGCRVESDQVSYLIRDNGVGMTEEQLADLFTPFQSFSKLGTGLGMSIVYDIVQMHDAVIDVRSRLGEGTEIEIQFARYAE